MKDIINFWQKSSPYLLLNSPKELYLQIKSAPIKYQKILEEEEMMDIGPFQDTIDSLNFYFRLLWSKEGNLIFVSEDSEMDDLYQSLRDFPNPPWGSLDWEKCWEDSLLKAIINDEKEDQFNHSYEVNKEYDSFLFKNFKLRLIQWFWDQAAEDNYFFLSPHEKVADLTQEADSLGIDFRSLNSQKELGL